MRTIIVTAIATAAVAIGLPACEAAPEPPAAPIDTSGLAELMMPTAATQPPDCASLPPVLRMLDAPCDTVVVR